MSGTTGLSLGIDIGSTTAKVVLVEDGKILYQNYQRHFSQVRQKTRSSWPRPRPSPGTGP